MTEGASKVMCDYVRVRCDCLGCSFQKQLEDISPNVNVRLDKSPLVVHESTNNLQVQFTSLG